MAIAAKRKSGFGDAVLTIGLVFILLAGYRLYHWFQERAAITEARRIEALPPQYGQWADRLNGDVIRTMEKNGFSGKWGGCGVIRYRVDLVHYGRFLVRCSATGSTWTEYVVDSEKNTVRGPYEPTPENN